MYQVKEVMKAVLHTILFHRCLIQTMPINVDLKVVGVSFVPCFSPALNSSLL